MVPVRAWWTPDERRLRCPTWPRGSTRLRARSRRTRSLVESDPRPDITGSSAETRAVPAGWSAPAPRFQTHSSDLASTAHPIAPIDEGCLAASHGSRIPGLPVRKRKDHHEDNTATAVFRDHCRRVRLHARPGHCEGGPEFTHPV